MRNKYVHIICNYKTYEPKDKLIKEVDKKLIRGCEVHVIEPLTNIESTQRIVHSVMKEHHLTPNNDDQQVFERLAEFTFGSPVLVEIASKSLLAEFNKEEKPTTPLVKIASKSLLAKSKEEEPDPPLTRFSDAILLEFDRKSRQHSKTADNARSVKKETDVSSVNSVKQEQNDVWDTNTKYDSWDSIEDLIQSYNFSPEERLLLNTLCIFSCSPISYSVVTEISSLIAMASQKPHIASILPIKLLELHLMKQYPSPVVLHPSFTSMQSKTGSHEFVYVPQYVSCSIWKTMVNDDRMIALSTMYLALRGLEQVARPLVAHFLCGLCYLLIEMLEFDLHLMGTDCYKMVWKLCLKYKPLNDKEIIDEAVRASLQGNQ